ncbi:MAG: hypothetical protein M1825_001144 [Sarcosagium campestre]|nr:MAG: hypothetical protein M1825_001144 [Sarcosagium campestre]
MSPYGRLLILAAVAACLHTCTSALSVPISLPKPDSDDNLLTIRAAQPARSSPGEDNNSCGFEGNSDIYGLGVRIGIYLQWAAALMGGQFLEETQDDVEQAETIFLTAIALATWVLSDVPTTHAVEIAILLCIFFGDTGVTLIQNSGSRMGTSAPTNKTPRSIIGATFRMLLITAMSIYAVWFWFHGMDDLAPTACKSYVFLFARVELFGGARTLFKVVSVLNLTLWGIIAITLLPAILVLVCAAAYIWASIAHMKRRDKKRLVRTGKSDTDADVELYRQRTRYVSFLRDMINPQIFPDDPQPGPSSLRARHPFLKRLIPSMMPEWAYINAAVMVWSILFLELTLRWNHITDVYTIRNSAGQLIPLMIGTGTFTKTLMAIVVSRTNKSTWTKDSVGFRLPRNNYKWIKFSEVKPERRKSI